MGADASVDLAFSFDSLVHCEADVIGGYLKELAHKLAPDGVGFIHHSNLGAFARYYAALGLLPARFRALLESCGLVDSTGWRARSMTAERFRALCQQAGLVCATQELINWINVVTPQRILPIRRTVDCLSVFTRIGSRFAGEYRYAYNPLFTAEAEQIRRMSNLYGG